MNRFAIRIYAAFALSLAVAACSTPDPKVEDAGSVEVIDSKTGQHRKVQSDYAAWLERSTARQELVDLKCPPSGCVLAGLTVYAPTAPGSIAPPQPKVEPVHPAWGVLDRLVGIGGTAMGIKFGAAGAVQLVREVGNAATAGYKFVQAPQPNITNTLSGTGVMGSGSYVGPNSGAQSGNSGRIGSDTITTNTTTNTNSGNTTTTLTSTINCSTGAGGNAGTGATGTSSVPGAPGGAGGVSGGVNCNPVLSPK